MNLVKEVETEKLLVGCLVERRLIVSDYSRRQVFENLSRTKHLLYLQVQQKTSRVFFPLTSQQYFISFQFFFLPSPPRLETKFHQSLPCITTEMNKHLLSSYYIGLHFPSCISTSVNKLKRKLEVCSSWTQTYRKGKQNDLIYLLKSQQGNHTHHDLFERKAIGCRNTSGHLKVWMCQAHLCLLPLDLPPPSFLFLLGSVLASSENKSTEEKELCLSSSSPLEPCHYDQW